MKLSAPGRTFIPLFRPMCGFPSRSLRSLMSVPITSPAETDLIDGPRNHDRRQNKNRGRKQYYGRTAKLGVISSMIRQFGNEVIGLPAGMIMARLLSPHEFGVAAA